MITLINGKLYTMEQDVFPNGFVTMEQDKIIAAGDMKTLKRDQCGDVVDVCGAYILPGFVDAHCHLGMFEDGIVFEGDDGNEDSDPLTPQLQAIDAVNPMDRCFEDAYRAGVTSVITGPGSANVLGGQFLAMKTYGSRIDKMVIKNPVAVKAAFGENPKSVYHAKNQGPVTRMAIASILREALFHAKEYKERLEKYYENPQENDKPDFDYKSVSLQAVLKQELPLKVHAHRADDIFTAIRIAEEFHINITLDHCTEGHIIADYLSEKSYPVMIGPNLCDRSKPELKNASLKTPKILMDKGISVAIITDHPEVPIQYLPLSAGLAMREGLTFEEALSAITINAARNTGISHQVGSIKPGKDADIVVTKQSPFDVLYQPQMVFISGRWVL